MKQKLFIVLLCAIWFFNGLFVSQLYIPKNAVPSFVRVIGPCQVYPVDIERAIQSGGVIEEK